MDIRKSAATLTAAGLLAGGAVLATVTGSATASTSYTTTRYVAHDVAGQLAMADIADPRDGSPGMGDVLAFTQRLTRGGKAAGRVSNVAIGVDAVRHLFQANGTMVLPHGRVEFAGLVPQTSHFVLAVTGGTGRYRDAAGTLTFDNVGGRKLLTLRWRH
jgi:hypothetical protein